MSNKKIPLADAGRRHIFQTLEEIGRAYHDVCPERYAHHTNFIRQARDGLLRPSGASEKGLISWRFSIPEELLEFIDFELHKRGILESGETFFQRWDNVELLLRAWPEWQVGT